MNVPRRSEATARLFWNGRSQAVRLPKAFRFPGDRVKIRREGEAVILVPEPGRGWPAGYWSRVAKLRRKADLRRLRRAPDPPPAPLEYDVAEP